jgi:hypothetical protein
MVKTTQPNVFVCQARGSGFFSELFSAISCIWLAKEHSAQPIPLWNKRFLYKHPSIGNSWSAYFEPTWTGGQCKDLMRDGMVTQLPASGLAPLPNHKLRQLRHVVHAIWRDDIKMIDEVVQDVAKLTKQIAPGTVGVHYRWTDRASDPKVGLGEVTPEEFFPEIDTQLDKFCDRVFLAADSEPAVRKFKLRYGDKLLVADAIRSPDGKVSVHGGRDKGAKGSAYEKGIEVLADALALSSCAYLVRNTSAVSFFSLCVSPQLRFTDMNFKLGRYKKLVERLDYEAG